METSTLTFPSESPLASLPRGYFPPAGSFDEMVDGQGAIRPHWQMFVKQLESLGPAELGRRWDAARRLIHDNGVTYNVYGDPAGMDRPWSVDALPVLFSAGEWTLLEEGLRQRARLLDAIVDDIYGPQTLLQEGLIPAALVFGHGGFLRPLHGAAVPGARRIHFYAADLGRGDDGRFCILRDRTQAPSGAGYALENRLVLSRAFPDVFRDCRVQRLATFFRTLRETLRALAPFNRDNPRIVLLTPGPYNETYFEHAYLARYLGVVLVEGADLTVRGNAVYLKMLGGLQPVDVILRRQDDDFCDPLELRPDSTLGVPGLVQAVHSGNVLVANALGSGIVESRAFLMYLPRLCRRLFNEDLKLPSTPTYWCGDSQARQEAFADFTSMVVKPAFSAMHAPPIFCGTLSQENLWELRGRIEANPELFVCQRRVGMSTAPALVGDRTEPRPIVVRTHLVARGDSTDYAVMPGGLTRFSAASDSLTVSMQSGGGSKDTWVLSGGPVDNFSLLVPPGQAVAISRGGGDLPSRIADNFYWLGRYLERAESLARLARGITIRLADQPGEPGAEIALLLATLAAQAGVVLDPDTTLERGLVRILFDAQPQYGLQATLASIYRGASQVRDRISGDTWRIVSQLDQDFPARPPQRLLFNDVLLGLDRLVLACAAFGGLAMESMTRGYAWRFLDMGRRVERAQAILALLRGTLVTVAKRESPILEAVLEIADSVMTYRRRYMTSIQAAPVLDLLMADETNPRSVAYQFARLAEHLAGLPQHDPIVRQGSADRVLLHAYTNVRLADMSTEAAATAEGPAQRRPQLDRMLASIIDDVHDFSDVVAQDYLSHAQAGRQLTFGAMPASSGDS